MKEVIGGVRLACGMRRWLRTFPAITAITASACATAGGPGVPQVVKETDHRVYDVAAQRFITFAALADRAAAADVVFFGEQHGHRPGHRLQLGLLQALAVRGGATLSLEMFERDVAPLVSAYAAGDASLADLMHHARPWPRYDTDYQPQVDFARDRRWRIVAANVPRPLANAIAREGRAVLDTLDATTRTHAAADIRCPDDAYRARFVEEMRRHPVGETEEERAAIEERYYASQCVKDETMAESIAQALSEGAERPIVHLSGAFHSDHGDGIPVRLQRRQPDARIISLTVVPVDNLRRADPAPHAARADYLLFTRRSPPPPSR